MTWEKKRPLYSETHSKPEVEATCDRILIINKGKIVANGTSETLRKQSQGNEILKLHVLRMSIPIRKFF